MEVAGHFMHYEIKSRPNEDPPVTQVLDNQPVLNGVALPLREELGDPSGFSVAPGSPGDSSGHGGICPVEAGAPIVA